MRAVPVGVAKTQPPSSAVHCTQLPMTARCARATNPVEPGTASVIPPRKTQAAVPDERSLMADEGASPDCIEPRACE
jgi:hypothetical protein